MWNTTDSRRKSQNRNRNARLPETTIRLGITFGALLILLITAIPGSAADPAENEYRTYIETGEDQGNLEVAFGETYGVSFSRSRDWLTLRPAHNASDSKEIRITVENEGDAEDEFDFEFGDDSQSRTYRKWYTLPDSIVLDAGGSEEIVIGLTVEPYHLDHDAYADGLSKNTTIIVYSKGARDSGQEEEGTTTDHYTASVEVREYRHASFTSISPSYIFMDDDDTALINVTIKNEGNGREEYSFIKDGEDGSGQNRDWYEFDESSVQLDPEESIQVSISVDPPSYAEAGEHDLYFHAESESSYDSEDEFFTVDIEEKYGGEFVSGSSKISDPGKTVSMSISVKNTGNARHDFRLDDPQVPDGWDNPTWSGGDNKSIPADSTGTFSLMIQIPNDFTKVPPGLYQFEVTGWFEDKGDSLSRIPGSIILNLTVNTVYGVEVSADEFSGESGEPGDELNYMIKVKNIGNVNDTYQISMLNTGNPSLEDGKRWTDVEGLTPENQVTIPVGETRYLPVGITIPEFTEDNDEAEKGLYGVKIKAESTNESDENSELVFEFEVEEWYRVSIWSDNPGKNELLRENDPTELTFTMNVRNLGNTNDDIIINVPNDEFSGEKRDWTAKFGTQTSKTLTLDSLSQQSVTLMLTIDKNTDPGEYMLHVRAESQGDTTAYTYTTLYINLTKPEYGVDLEKFPTATRKVNPADESEIEFKFTLWNIGNQDDTYTIEVETPLGSGVYKGWTMEFEDKTNDRVDQLVIPTDLKGNTDLYLPKGDRVDIALYVIVAVDESEGTYEDIAISATSDNDNAQTDYLYFNLTVILPNIRVGDSETEFYIEPDSGIEEGDSIDINVRIYNDGDAETDEFWVFFYNGKGESPTDLAGNYIAMEKVDNIPAGQYTDVLGTLDEIEGGENDIYVYADKPVKAGDGKTFIDNSFSDMGLVFESRENDNTASIADRFQEAINLEFESFYDVLLSASRTSIELDDEMITTIVLTVANSGDVGDTYDLSVHGSFEGWNITLDSELSIPLEPGESKDFSMIISDDPDVAGGENISVTVTVRSRTDDEIVRIVVISGKINDDADVTAIPFISPPGIAIALGGGGLIAAFRRRKHL